MGPRLFSRGNYVMGEEIKLKGRGASMGPRLFSRGNSRARDTLTVRRSGFNGATAF